MTGLIVTSAVAEDAPQADGRRWITERHTDLLGRDHDFRYLADADAEPAAGLAARADTLAQRLVADEIAWNLDEVRQRGPDAVLRFEYSTQPQSIVAMAVRAQGGALSEWETVLLARFLAVRLGPDVLMSLVGMSAQQVAVLQGVVQSVATALATVGAVISAIAAGAAAQEP